MSEKTTTKREPECICDLSKHPISKLGQSGPCLSFTPSESDVRLYESEKAGNRRILLPTHVCMPMWQLHMRICGNSWGGEPGACKKNGFSVTSFFKGPLFWGPPFLGTNQTGLKINAGHICFLLLLNKRVLFSNNAFLFV